MFHVRVAELYYYGVYYDSSIHQMTPAHNNKKLWGRVLFTTGIHFGMMLIAFFIWFTVNVFIKLYTLSALRAQRAQTQLQKIKDERHSTYVLAHSLTLAAFDELDLSDGDADAGQLSPSAPSGSALQSHHGASPSESDPLMRTNPDGVDTRRPDGSRIPGTDASKKRSKSMK
jgi:hypothetical protein